MACPVTRVTHVSMRPVSAPSLPQGHSNTHASKSKPRVDAFIATAVNALPSTSRGFGAAIVTVGFVLLLLIPAGAAAQVVLTAQLDDRSVTQAVVVLDPARSWGNPTELMSARLTHAAELYREGVAPLVMVTGPKRDAAAVKSQLVNAGVDPRDVVAITTGSDTVGALQVVANVMRGIGWSSITVVTDPAHAARAAATAGGFGIDAHLSPADSGPSTALNSDSVARETLALLRYQGFTRWQQSPIIR